MKRQQGFNPHIFGVRAGILFVMGVLFLALGWSVMSDVHPAELPVIYFFLGANLIGLAWVRRHK